MFADKQATAMIPAKDVERARKWYEEKLGIKPSGLAEYGASFQLNGVNAFLYPTEFAGTAQHTLLSFRCEDLRGDMAEMRKRGVVFLDYDLPGLKTVDGVADFSEGMLNAWAKDSEGNILGFVQGM